jgi:hypothetical protein
MLMANTFNRWAGLAGALGGLLIVIGVFINLSFAGSAFLISLLSLLGILGIFLVVRSAGHVQFGIVGGLAVLIGTILLLFSQNLILAGSFFGVGLLILVYGMHQAGGFPNWVIGLWVLAPILGVLGLMAIGPVGLLQQIGAILLGLGFIGAGYHMWAVKG